MSSGSLQLSLAVLGGLGLAGLVAYNTWTARKTGVRSVTTPADADAPQAKQQLDPVFDSTDEIPTVPNPLAAEDAAAATAAPEPLAAPVVRRYVPRLDPLIDALTTLALESPVSGEQALAHLPTTRRAGGKPFFIEGLDTETGAWEPPQAGHRYGEFQGGVQLANRTGAINEIEYSEFVQKLQAFADAIGASLDSPDMLEVVARGRELDIFASEHDAQLAMRLVARTSAWSPGYLQQHAARHGFVPGVIPGRLVLPAHEEGAPPILTLTFDAQAAYAEEGNQSAVRELSLAFDVPQTAPEHEPFLAWRAAGEALAQALDAHIADDAGNPLPPQAFDSIGKELARLYEALASRDLAAGSQAARRLFS
ncbi:cell division protein FtsZ [Aquabacterium sp.]|uniref:cell division protein FtsZ n=1 Tax=Aquabacterium sp. TaxID=1872578 RepID=UPI0035B22DB5